MNDKAFIDTNIFIYTQRSDDITKREISKQVINHFDCVASTQVLNEICNILTKKFPTPRQDITLFLQDIKENCEISIVTDLTIDSALAIHERWKYAYYDSVIIASALENNCDYIISEDLQDKQVIDKKLQIINVFQHPEILN